MVIALVRFASRFQNFGPVRQSYCRGLVRRTYVFAGIDVNAAVLNQCFGVGLEMQGLPVTIRFPNCGKSPEIKVERPASFQPPKTASTARGVEFRKAFPFPKGSSQVLAMLKR